jgi:uncharacterized protein YbjT (DUF2867 family)
MSEKKIITVFGATGAQGGGLVRAILNDRNSEFTVRAVTRDASSDKARALAALGAEVVTANADDPASLAKALEGAYGAYFVTFFWEHFSTEKEGQEVKNYAEAAKAAGIQHAIWSTLEDTRKFVPLSDERMPTLQGNYKVPHFDAKGESDHYFTDLGVPTTFLLASYYLENLIHFGMGPKKGPDGTLAITFPMGKKRMSVIAAEDIGKCAYGIFKGGSAMIGKRIGLAGDEPTMDQLAAALSKAIGQTVVYNEVPAAVYRGFGFPGAEDLGNMFQFYADFEEVCIKTRDVAYSKVLNPELQNLETWLANNVSRIPLN